MNSASTGKPLPRRITAATRALYEMRTYVSHRLAVESLATLAADYRRINGAHAAALAVRP
jgi:hypothetical protein